MEASTAAEMTRGDAHIARGTERDWMTRDRLGYPVIRFCYTTYSRGFIRKRGGRRGMEGGLKESGREGHPNTLILVGKNKICRINKCYPKIEFRFISPGC